jgi:glycosyltransferase involved in cell wall biosynthesis
MSLTVASFTDTYHATINGVTYTLDNWAEKWNSNHGCMKLVYPSHPEYTPESHEFPAFSVSFPQYESYRASLPWIPRAVWNPDIVHIHSFFTLGASGIALAKTTNTPLVATYHTPINEYSEYIFNYRPAADGLSWALRQQEKCLLKTVDLIIVPSKHTRSYLKQELGTQTEISIISNGVDINKFKPTDGNHFRDNHNLTGPLVGYTGRHGHEKEIRTLLLAAEKIDQDLTVVIGGDGPARQNLESLAAKLDLTVKFLGFLPRKELPKFYSAIDVFGFPSPIETEGIVAMEAIACGTPVVATDTGALSQTVTHGKTGYLFSHGSVKQFASYLSQAIASDSTLQEKCLSQRDKFSINESLNKIKKEYKSLLK